MSVLDALLEGNDRFVSAEWDPTDAELPAAPAQELAVVACMDTRYNVERVLGLGHGDAKIIRNAGNILDDGTLRSLVVGVHLLGVKRVVVMGHTKCGMMSVGRGDFRIAKSLVDRCHLPQHEVMRPDFQRWLGGFEDVDANVRRSLGLLRKHPLMPEDLEVYGLVYDNDTGRVTPVKDA